MKTNSQFHIKPGNLSADARGVAKLHIFFETLFIVMAVVFCYLLSPMKRVKLALALLIILNDMCG